MLFNGLPMRKNKNTKHCRYHSTRQVTGCGLVRQPAKTKIIKTKKEKQKMSCPYYYFDHDYCCRKTGERVNEDIYYKYCKRYDYDDCPIYKY